MNIATPITTTRVMAINLTLAFSISRTSLRRIVFISGFLIFMLYPGHCPSWFK